MSWYSNNSAGIGEKNGKPTQQRRNSVEILKNSIKEARNENEIWNIFKDVELKNYIEAEKIFDILSDQCSQFETAEEKSICLINKFKSLIEKNPTLKNNKFVIKLGEKLTDEQDGYKVDLNLYDKLGEKLTDEQDGYKVDLNLYDKFIEFYIQFLNWKFLRDQNELFWQRDQNELF